MKQGPPIWSFKPPSREAGESQRDYARRVGELNKLARKVWHDRRRRATWGPNNWVRSA